MSSNQDLQATHQIVSILERSKAESDRVLDALPGVFAIVDGAGLIYRGNALLAKIKNSSIEDLLGRNLSNLFSKENWNLFETQFKKVVGKHQLEVEFELPTDQEGGSGLHFFWHIGRLESSQSGIELDLYSVLARDISELRKKEKQLSDLYSTIPLGIMTINQEGRVEGPYSSQVEYLLGALSLQGKTIKEILFDPAWAGMRQDEKEGVQGLLATLGKDERFFDILRPSYPQELYHPAKSENEGGKYLGLQYQPIVLSGKVDRIFLTIEDRTEVVQNRMEQQKVQALEELGVKRIIELKKCPPHVANLLMKEMSQLMVKIEEGLTKKDLKPIRNALHGMKGNSRIAGLSHLTELAHSLESYIRDHTTEGSAFPWNELKTEIQDLLLEWTEIMEIFPVIHKSEAQGPKAANAFNDVLMNLVQKYNLLLQRPGDFQSRIDRERINQAMLVANQSSLQDLEDLLRFRVEGMSRSTEKELHLQYSVTVKSVDPSHQQVLNEALVHLISNAAVHGIEPKDVRLARGKPTEGLIMVQISENADTLTCRVVDDGAGLDLDRIKKRLLHMGLMSLREIENSNRDVLVQSIFESGFSTSDEETDLSGRGVGLAAVKASVEALGGVVKVFEREEGGSEFQILIPLRTVAQLKKNCVSLGEWHSLLSDYLNQHAQLHNKTLFRVDLSGLPKVGLMWIDEIKLATALSGYAMSFDWKKPTVFRCTGAQHGRLCYEITGQKLPATETPPEILLPQKFVSTVISGHDGKVDALVDSVRIQVSRLIRSEELPQIEVQVSPLISEMEAAPIQEMIRTAAQGFGFRLQGEAQSNVKGVLKVEVVRKRDPYSFHPQILVTDSSELIQAKILSAIDTYLGASTIN